MDQENESQYLRGIIQERDLEISKLKAEVTSVEKLISTVGEKNNEHQMILLKFRSALGEEKFQEIIQSQIA